MGSMLTWNSSISSGWSASATSAWIRASSSAAARSDDDAVQAAGPRPTKRSTYSSKYAHCAAVSRRIFPARAWRESESRCPPFQSPSHLRSMSQQRQKSCGGPLALQQRQGVVVRAIGWSAGGRPHTSGGGRRGPQRRRALAWWSSSPPSNTPRARPASPPIIRLSRPTPGEKPCTDQSREGSRFRLRWVRRTRARASRSRLRTRKGLVWLRKTPQRSASTTGSPRSLHGRSLRLRPFWPCSRRPLRLRAGLVLLLLLLLGICRVLFLMCIVAALPFPVIACPLAVDRRSRPICRVWVAKSHN
ncbi:hypothetical protein DFJ73DRAFT_881130 [Zopfochytrium polystomum]|nr:hypothetical protein DFJ73DRAFT_881130 [Zopfochytrium polystomum]